jgi:hypothetical protein
MIIITIIYSLTLSCKGVFSYSLRNVSPIDRSVGSELFVATALLIMKELDVALSERYDLIQRKKSHLVVSQVFCSFVDATRLDF